MLLETAPLEISISRRFAAPPEIVFGQWLDAEALRDWFAPDTYEGVSAEADAREGGRWEVRYRSPTGKEFAEQGTYLEIVPGQRLVMTLAQSGAAQLEATQPQALTIVVTFEPDGGGTLMRFRQTGFASRAQRDGMAEGWEGCLRKLAGRIEQAGPSQANDPVAEAEVRRLFADWFAASERKDLDASMAPISEDIVSYEHSAPLQVCDVAGMRKECRRGFEQAGPEFRWDVPDLRVIVRGDIAVTWGLNRMASRADGTTTEMWSRGTRVLQRMDGRWRMIHQHVSFPVDTSTGQSRMDLVP